MRPSRVLFSFIAFLVSTPFTALAESDIIATLESAEGTLQVGRVGTAVFNPVATGATFKTGDVIKTGRSSRAGIAFANGGFLRLGENTMLEFKPGQGEKKQVAVDEGKAYYFSRDPRNSPLVDTPSASLAIRGTEFGLEVTTASTSLAVLDGGVECSNAQGTVEVGKGEQAYVEKGKAPVKTILLKPLDAVQWALSYPDLPMQGAASDRLKEASFLISRGQADKAEDLLKKIDSDAASLPETERASVHSAVLAQQSIISLTRDNKSESLRLANEATNAAPASPSALLARSYAAQASFRLDEAEEWTRKLVESSPDLGVGYARLAELKMGDGHLDEALDYAGKGVQLDPENGYVQAVYGFTRMLQNDNEGAISTFETALALSPSLALARLGLGLARIHSGDLEGGRKDIERATFLSPNVALYRSYLGKAYFEEEEETKAGHEYARAIDMDPLDPTPFLYRAFNRLSANDVIGALEDVEHSIDLNNNRAVYRSSLLLDQDVATRTAGLAKIYGELGFAQAGQIEAIKSISKDYSNYSAHLFLADSYRSEFLNDASQSERFITNLLAPLSFNLFQQQASSVGFNEYDALFDRPDNRTELGGSFSTYHDYIAPFAHYAQKGEDWAYGGGIDTGVLSGSKHYRYSRLYSANLSGSWQPGYANRVTGSGEFSYLRYRDPLSAPESNLLEGGKANIGYLHTFDSNSKFISFLSYSNDRNRFLSHDFSRPAIIDEISEGETTSFDELLDADSTDRQRVNSVTGGAQHILSTRLFSTVNGLEYHLSDVQRRENSLILEDEFGYFDDYDYYIRTKGFNDVSSADIYSYNTVHVLPQIDLTLGGSYSFVQVEDREYSPFVDGTKLFNRFNPKLGVTAYPVKDLTLRWAWFEGLRKSILEDPVTIEPSLVGGFNQLFNEWSGAKTRNLGVGADYKISGSTFTGAEWMRRNVRFPSRPAVSDFTFNYDSGELTSDVAIDDLIYGTEKEDLVRGYVSQVVTDRIAATLQYEWSDFNQEDLAFIDAFRTNVASLGVKYFDPTGFFPYAVGTWGRQNTTGSEIEGNYVQNFWTVDAGLGYRLPKRHGMVALEVQNIFDRDFQYNQKISSEDPLHSGVAVALITSINF